MQYHGDEAAEAEDDWPTQPGVAVASAVWGSDGTIQVIQEEAKRQMEQRHTWDAFPEPATVTAKSRDVAQWLLARGHTLERLQPSLRGSEFVFSNLDGTARADMGLWFKQEAFGSCTEFAKAGVMVRALLRVSYQADVQMTLDQWLANEGAFQHGNHGTTNAA